MICVNCTGETTGPKITEPGGPGPCERENREQRIYWSDTRRPSRSPTTVVMTEQVVLFRGATAVMPEFPGGHEGRAGAVARHPP